MDIQKFSLDQLFPAPFNPRVSLKPGDKEYEEIKKSLSEFGAVEPLIFNKQSGFLVSGHQRLKVLRELGYTEIEVVVVDLSPRQEKKLNLAINKISGRWDELKLPDVLEDLYKELDSDLESTGFTLPEITEFIDSKRDLEDDGFDFDAAVGAVETPITQPGDLIELGRHRLLCGDSTSPDNLKFLMNHEQAHLLITDPPYCVKYMGGSRPNPDARPKRSRNWEKIYNDDWDKDGYEEWLGSIFKNMMPWLLPGTPCYIWNAHKNFSFMHNALTKLGFKVSSVITWVKESFSIDYADYHGASEFCLYAWVEGPAHRWYGPTNESTVWQVKRDPTKSYVHPTQKPIALAQRAIRNSSLQNEIVLDLFLGSGSTLIAAETLGRRCYGVELDPKYCDAIIRRYISLVGKDKVSPELRERYVKEETPNV